jgi:predicted RNA-binding protein with TRAM domain
MTDRSDTLRCLFGATVREEEGEYLFEIPAREVEAETLTAGDRYRFAVLDGPDESGRPGDGEGHSRREAPESPQPPVEIGEMRYVEVEDIGDQGDGIARVERGYVIIVPDAEEGERVKIEVTDVKPNFAIARVVDRGV